MDTKLEIREESFGGDALQVLRLNGPLVLANLFDFQTKVRASQAKTLALDLTQVPYIDSAGVGVLVGAYVSRDKDGRRLVLVGAPERIRHTLQVTQVERFFEFADKVPEA